MTDTHNKQVQQKSVPVGGKVKMNLDAAACPKSGGGRIFSCGGDFYGAAHKAITHEL